MLRGIDAGNDPAAVERAGIGSVEDDLALLALQTCVSAIAGKLAGHEVSGKLARNTGEREAVGTVWRELQSQQAIVKIKVSADAFADRRVGRQNQQA